MFIVRPETERSWRGLAIDERAPVVSQPRRGARRRPDAPAGASRWLSPPGARTEVWAVEGTGSSRPAAITATVSARAAMHLERGDATGQRPSTSERSGSTWSSQPPYVPATDLQRRPAPTPHSALREARRAGYSHADHPPCPHASTSGGLLLVGTRPNQARALTRPLSGMVDAATEADWPVVALPARLTPDTRRDP